MILVALIFTFAGIVSTLLLIPVSRLLPDVFSANSLQGFFNISVAVIAIYISRGIFIYLQNYISAYVSIKSASDFRKKLYSRILDSNPEKMEQNQTGQLITVIIDDINKIRDMFFSLITEFIPSLITLCFTLTYIFYLNWKLAILVLLLIPAIGGIINLFSSLLKQRAKRIQDKIAESYDTLHENFVNYQAIKVFALEKLKKKEFDEIESQNLRENTASFRLLSLQPSVIGVVQVSGIAMIACFGGYEMINNRLSLSDLLAFGTALSLTIEPVIFLTKSAGIINSNRVSLERAINFEQKLKNDLNKVVAGSIEITNYSLEFKNISFSYPGNEAESLKNINLKISEGEMIALKGENGSGKSSLLKILLGYYHSYQGALLIGSQDIKEYSQSSIRKNIKASFHEAYLFRGTIRENIEAGTENPSEELFLKVAEICSVDEFVQDLEEKYEYQVGDFGNRLSSGQKQRIALARAIISKPLILILDEASSALDLEAERKVYKGIKEFLPVSTIIFVNHRHDSLSFIKKQYYMQDGKILTEKV